MSTFKEKHKVMLYPPTPERVPFTKDLVALEEMIVGETKERTTDLEEVAQTAKSGTPVLAEVATLSIPIGVGISLDFTAKTAGAAGKWAIL
jgi:hypothetical protein